MESAQKDQMMRKRTETAAGAGANKGARRGQAAASASAKNVAAPVDLGHLPTILGYVLRRAQLAVYQDFAQTYAEFGIRPAQYAALTIIERNPGLKQKDVSAALGIKRANFVSMCDELERLDLAARRPVATDRRSYALHLTRKGKALMKKLHAANQEHENRLTAQIGEAGRDTLIALLTTLASAAESANGDGGEES
jgi:DNA-binding MarR family transcriptional regulator